MSKVAALPNIEDLSSRILDVYSRAPKDARGWYANARAEASRMAREHGVSLKAAAGVIAALSPQTLWERNLELAEQFLSTGRASYFSRGNEKAARIVSGEDPLSVLSGPKVRAFYSNLYDPSSDAVTIDRHAHDLAVGQRFGDGYRPYLRAKGGYDHFANAYRKAAADVGIPPHELQAATWETWRRDSLPRP